MQNASCASHMMINSLSKQAVTPTIFIIVYSLNRCFTTIMCGEPSTSVVHTSFAIFSIRKRVK